MSALREIRIELKWTQERMASELCVSTRTYSRQEAAGGDGTLRKLAGFISRHAKALDPECEVTQPALATATLPGSPGCQI